MPTPAYTLADQQLMSLAKNYFAWQARLVKRELGPRVLEVGCGIGNFTQTLADREAVLSIDMEPACVEQLQNRLKGQKNLRAVVSASPQAHQSFKADSCVCLNVLEHIEDDHRALFEMREAIVPGGAIVLIVPAFPVLFGAIDRNLGHYRRYTRRTLHRAATEAGLRPQTLRYMNFIGFFGWWANAHLFRREAQSASQIVFYDRYLVPLLSRLEAVVPPPLGQSLFAVLRKA